MFDADLSSLQQKPVDPASIKPVGALELPENCIRELDFVQLKTYLTLAVPTGLDVDALEK